MKTPRLDEPHVMAVIIIAHMIGINTIVLLLFIKSQTGIQIARGNAIIGISCYMSYYFPNCILLRLEEKWRENC